MMTFGRLLLSSSVVLSLAAIAEGAAFRGSQGLDDGPHGLSDLLHELEKVAGRDHRLATESRVDRLEQAMRPAFASMPKDADGLLNSAGVRYLLHRLFVQRHGWFVQGLDNDGEAWNSSSPAAVFQAHSGDHHALFDEKLMDKGFSLHQVAVFAATLETLVHAENIERLEATYRVQGLSRSEALSDSEAAETIRGYMVVLVRIAGGIDTSAITRRQYQFHDQLANETYPTWPDTVQFAEGVRQRIIEDLADDERTSWETNLKVVEEIGERYGRWQSRECHVLKNMLLGLEQPGTGRVRLEDFYGPALSNESWQFVESVPYLRQLGALDESDPERPSVVIPNYLSAPTNCVAGSKFYSVCCIDECEDLLGTLEEQIAEPQATPERILELVSALPSDTVQAPRVLPSNLVERLQEIANYHGGAVPLHGRLFAQWMHHAYPRECPYPHISGTTRPATQEEWIAQGDTPIEAGMEEIEKILKEAKVDRSSDEQATVLPWHAEEELFVSQPKLPAKQGGITGYVIQALFAVFLLIAAFMLSQPRGGKSKSLLPSYSSNHKYYV